MSRMQFPKAPLSPRFSTTNLVSQAFFRITKPPRGNFRTSPGETGPRNILRGDDYINTDLGLGKTFRLPWEGHILQVRWEMFNSFNKVNLAGLQQNPIDDPLSFGRFFDAEDPRVMWFGLRYSW